jgi:cholesterol transport system auxiliary component
MNKHLILLLFTALVLGCAACVKVGGKPLDKRFYRIAPVRAQSLPAPQDGTVLNIRRLAVSDLYNTREIIYQLADGRMESDFYNLYFITPGSMLTSELRDWLAASGQFPHIVTPGSMVVPDLTLEGVVNTLYGDFSSTPPAAVMSMQFFLVDESTPDNTILFSKNYTQRIPLSQPTAQELVQALTEGARTIFTQLENDLAQTPLKR